MSGSEVYSRLSAAEEAELASVEREYADMLVENDKKVYQDRRTYKERTGRDLPTTIRASTMTTATSAHAGPPPSSLDVTYRQMVTDALKKMGGSQYLKDIQKHISDTYPDIKTRGKWKDTVGNILTNECVRSASSGVVSESSGSEGLGDVTSMRQDLTTTAKTESSNKFFWPMMGQS